MTEQPSTFTAPATGRYHFVSGQEPHLVEGCTDECQIGSAFSRTAGSTVELSSRGMPADMSVDWTPLLGEQK